jgi:hypothetical protein
MHTGTPEMVKMSEEIYISINVNDLSLQKAAKKVIS